MSIVVKGMEMPKNCTLCDSIGLNVAIGCPVMTGINGRATDCPLVEIPEKHGRLIDADDAIVTLSSALEKAIREKDDAIAFTIGAIEGFLKASQTVIEAEGQDAT